MSMRITNQASQKVAVTVRKPPWHPPKLAGWLLATFVWSPSPEPRVRSTNPRSTSRFPPLLSPSTSTGRRLFSRTLARCSIGAKVEIVASHKSLETYLWAYRGNQPAVRMHDPRDPHASGRACKRRFIWRVISPTQCQWCWVQLRTHVARLAFFLLLLHRYFEGCELSRSKCIDIALSCDYCRRFLIG